MSSSLSLFHHFPSLPYTSLPSSLSPFLSLSAFFLKKLDSIMRFDFQKMNLYSQRVFYLVSYSSLLFILFVSFERGHKTKISLPPLLGKKKKFSVLFKMRYISSVFQLFWTFPLATLQRRELLFINIIH